MRERFGVGVCVFLVVSYGVRCTVVLLVSNSARHYSRTCPLATRLADPHSGSDPKTFARYCACMSVTFGHTHTHGRTDARSACARTQAVRLFIFPIDRDGCACVRCDRPPWKRIRYSICETVRCCCAREITHTLLHIISGIQPSLYIRTVIRPRFRNSCMLNRCARTLTFKFGPFD